VDDGEDEGVDFLLPLLIRIGSVSQKLCAAKNYRWGGLNNAKWRAVTALRGSAFGMRQDYDLSGAGLCTCFWTDFLDSVVMHKKACCVHTHFPIICF